MSIIHTFVNEWFCSLKEFQYNSDFLLSFVKKTLKFYQATGWYKRLVSRHNLHDPLPEKSENRAALLRTEQKLNAIIAVRIT